MTWGVPIQDVPAGTLVGEYCGVLDRLDGLDTRDMEDPLGLDMLRRDKVTEVEYTSKEGQDAEGMGKGEPWSAEQILECGIQLRESSGHQASEGEP